MDNTNKILVDWLTFTSQIHSKENLIDMLGLEGLTFTEAPGLYGYKSRLVFGNISIMYDGFSEDMGVCVSMSGQGCRDFETYGHGDWLRLFSEISSEEGVNITRLDVAYDDFVGLLDIDNLCYNIQHHYYVSPMAKWAVEYTSSGSSAYIGSPASPVRIRFYDKAAERGITDGSHWVRCEMQLRKKRAAAFVELLLSDDINGDIGELYFSVLNNYVRFVVPGNDTNLSRCDTALWWLDFVGCLRKISLFTAPGTEYNERNLERYVVKQAGNSICAYINCIGLDQFMNDIKNRGTVLNPRQQNIVNKYDRLSDDEKIFYLYQCTNQYGFDGDFAEAYFSGVKINDSDADDK